MSLILTITSITHNFTKSIGKIILFEKIFKIYSSIASLITIRDITITINNPMVAE